jgi:hypothetical protein
VSAGRFLGFVVHENGIEIDPKKVEAIKRIPETTCKREVQSLLGKVNYLRCFISNLEGRLKSLLPLVRMKHEREFTSGVEQQRAFKWVHPCCGLLRMTKSLGCTFPLRRGLLVSC